MIPIRRYISLICLAAGLTFADAGQTPASGVAQPLAPPALKETSYPVDADSFFRLVRRAIGEKEIHSDAEVLRIYFKQNQIDLARPSSVTFNSATKSVVVSSTAENLAKVKALLPAPPPPLPALYVRTFQVNTNIIASARRALGDSQDLSDPYALLRFFKSQGVELPQPSSFFYSYGHQALVVRSTEQDLEAIEKLVAELRSKR